MKVIQIPDEGFKLLAIAGTYEGKPIWRTVGKLVVSKKGVPIIQVDKTFNPAGVQGEKDSATIILNCVEYSEEELKKKAYYQQERTPPQPGHKFPPKTKITNEYFGNDFDDDIPF